MATCDYDEPVGIVAIKHKVLIAVKDIPIFLLTGSDPNMIGTMVVGFFQRQCKGQFSLRDGRQQGLFLFFAATQQDGRGADHAGAEQG